ncbi:hypothetical protein [Alicycliphilus denitrificans]|uniref:hypothetical protein n=1 Tax=Alicycliphilus denitrificans TaxID=179636 RepID=UPI0011C37185|nr:hypothetical protein [Alicycliphilus denitrificans]
MEASDLLLHEALRALHPDGVASSGGRLNRSGASKVANLRALSNSFRQWKRRADCEFHFAALAAFDYSATFAPETPIFAHAYSLLIIFLYEKLVH